MTVQIWYHADCDDGLAAALAAYLKYGDDAKYIPVAYGKPVPRVHKGDDIFILDFSYPPEVLLPMSLILDVRIAMLDHHVTAIRKWDGLMMPPNVYALFDMDQSGAMLAWKYFNNSLDSSERPPLFFQYIQARDLWKLDSLPNIDYFTHALRSCPRSIGAWGGLCEDDAVEELISEGHGIKRAFDAMLDMIKSTQGAGVPLTLRTGIGSNAPVQKYYGLAMNASKIFSSELAGWLAEMRGSFGMTWYTDFNNMAHCSLRSLDDKTDVSLIAQSYGGGGHKRAAGFSITLDRLQHLLNGEEG